MWARITYGSVASVVTILNALIDRYFAAATTLIVLLIYAVVPIDAATFQARPGVGHWDVIGYWILIDGSDADGIPDADDEVIINYGDEAIDMYLTYGESAQQIAIASNEGTSTARLILNTGSSLEVANHIVVGVRREGYLWSHGQLDVDLIQLSDSIASTGTGYLILDSDSLLRARQIQGGAGDGEIHWHDGTIQNLPGQNMFISSSIGTFGLIYGDGRNQTFAVDLNQIIECQASLIGDGDLRMDGPGELRMFSNNPSWLGDFYLEGGTVGIGMDGVNPLEGVYPLGTGSLHITNNSTIANYNPNGQTISNPYISIEGNPTFVGGDLEFDTTVMDLEGVSITLNVENHTTFTNYNAIFGAPVLLTKEGSGLLEGFPIYVFDNVIINEGQIVTDRGGDMDITNHGMLTFDIESGSYYSKLHEGVISGTGWVSKEGSGILTLGGVNTCTGYTLITDGTLRLGASERISDASTVLAHGTFDLNGFDETIEGLNTLVGLSAEGLVQLGNGGTLTIAGSQTLAFPGVISGSGHLTKTGTGQQQLVGSSPNTFTGLTTVNQGSLVLSKSSGNAIGGDLLINGGTVFLGNTEQIPDTSQVTVNSGQFTLNGYSETIGELGGSGGVVSILSGDTLTVDQAANSTYGGTIEGQGDLIKAGAGILTLTGANTYAGGTTITGGALKGDTTSLQGSMVNNASVIFDEASAGLYMGAISGPGSVTKTGTGSVWLTNINTYTGGTTIDEGTLQCSTSSLPGDVVNNGWLLFNQWSTGTFSGVISGSGEVTMDDSGFGAKLTLDAANTYDGLTTVESGQVILTNPQSLGTTASGTVVKNGGAVFLSNSTGTDESLFIEGQGGVLGYGALAAHNGGEWAGPITLTGDTTFSVSGLFANMTVSGNIGDDGLGSTLTLDTWDWTNTILLSGVNSYGGATMLLDEGTVRIGGIGAIPDVSTVDVGDGTLDLNDFSEGIGGLTGSSSSQAALGSATLTVGYNNESTTFAGIISGAGALIKVGTGTLTLTGANTHTGGTVVTQGTLILEGAALQGDLTTDELLVLDYDTTGAYGGVISGAGGVTKSGSGTLTFTAENTYTGVTIVNEGILQIGADELLGDDSDLLIDGCAFDLQGFDETVDLVTLVSGEITGAGTLTGTTYVVESGTISASLGGDASLEKITSGTVILTGANTYTGTTTITEGILRLSDTGRLSDLTDVAVSGTFELTDGATDTIDGLTGIGIVSLDSGCTLAVGGNDGDATFPGVILGAGSFAKTGSGTQTLLGSNTHTGGTTVLEGTLKGNTTSLRGTITNNATLLFDEASNATYNGLLHNNGDTLLIGGHEFTFAASSLDNTGTVDMQDGTLHLTGGGTWGGEFHLSTGTSLRLDNGTYNFDSTSQISGGDVTLDSSQTLNVAGLYDVAGHTQLNGGPLNIISTGPNTIGTLTMPNSGSTLGGSGEVTVSGLTTWTAGTMTGTGITQANGGMDLSGTPKYLIGGRTVNNGGAATWTAGNFYTGGGSVFNNQLGATFDTDFDGTFDYNQGGGIVQFNNAGTFTKSGGTGTTTIDLPLTNNGTVDVDTGTLHLTRAGGSSSGTFDIASGAVLRIGADFTFNTGASSIGDGTLQISSGTSTVAGDTSLSNFLLAGGTLGGSGVVTVSGLTTWTAGTMTGTGITQANGGMDLSGTPKYLIGGRTVNNGGAATWTAGNFYTGGGSVFNNQLGATFDTDFDGTFDYNQGGGIVQFNNAGTFTKSGGTGTTTIDLPLTNNGTVDVDTGTLHLTRAGGSSSGTFDIASGAVLRIGADFTFNTGASSIGDGTLRISGGTSTVAGDTTLSNFLLTGGTLGGEGSITIDGASSWNGGTLSGSGTGLVLDGSGLLTIGTSSKFFTGQVSNAGTILWTGGEIDSSFTGSTFSNTGTIDLQGDGTSFDTSSTGSIVNEAGGILSRTVGTSTATIDLPLTNNGIVDVDTGTLRLTHAGGSSSGTFDIASGAMLRISADYTFESGASSIGDGTLQISSGTSTVAGDTSLSNFLLAGGTLGGSGVVTVSGLTTWTAGTMTGTGITQANGGMDLSGTPKYLIGGRTVNNGGAATWTAGNFYTGGGSVFNNQLGATFDTDFDGTFDYNQGGGIVQFNNAGTFTKSGGTGTTTIDLPLTNNGTVDVDTGTLHLTRAGGSSSGTFDIASGAVLRIGADFTFNTGASSIGDGTLRISGGTSTVAGDTTLSNFLLTGGTLGGEGSITIDGASSWNGGTLSGSGTGLVLDGSGLLTIGTSSKFFTGQVSNAGTILWTGGEIDSSFTGSTFSNTGTIDLQGDGTSFDTSSTGSIVNEAGGILSRTVGTSTATIDLPLTNNGTVDVQTGTAAFTRGYTQTAGITRVASGAELVASSTLDIQSGRVEGGGLIDANVDLADTLAPGLSAGQLYIEGNLNFIDAAIYEWELDGSGLSDSLDVTGNLIFGSTASLALVDLGGTPDPLTEYTLFTYSGSDPTNPTWNFDTSGALGWDVSSLVVSVDTVGDRVFMLGLDVGVGLTADFDNDSDVDSDDLAQWEGDFGVNGDSDADGDLDSDGADFLAWQRQFGSSFSVLPATTEIPEPATLQIMVLAGMLLMMSGCASRKSPVSGRRKCTPWLRKAR